MGKSNSVNSKVFAVVAFSLLALSTPLYAGPPTGTPVTVIVVQDEEPGTITPGGGSSTGDATGLVDSYTPGTPFEFNGTVPPVTLAPPGTKPVNSQGASTSSGSSSVFISVLERRPDYDYHAPSLSFQDQGTYLTGQKGLGMGPGIASASPRYVPVGEF